MFSIIKSGALLLCLLVSQSAHAHIAGVTDTSVQIHASGLTLIYTVPKDNLQELELAPNADNKSIESAVFKGFQFLNDDTACVLRIIQDPLWQLNPNAFGLSGPLVAV